MKTHFVFFLPYDRFCCCYKIYICITCTETMKLYNKCFLSPVETLSVYQNPQRLLLKEPPQGLPTSYILAEETLGSQVLASLFFKIATTSWSLNLFSTQCTVITHTTLLMRLRLTSFIRFPTFGAVFSELSGLNDRQGWSWSTDLTVPCSFSSRHSNHFCLFVLDVAA